MGQYSSYYLYQKYVSREGGDFVPVYPEVYSIDADGTMPKVIRLEEDTACGFNPNPDVKYRWYVKYTDLNDYICYNYSKYYYEYYQVSYNNGVTWQDVTPIQKRRSSTIWEANSYDCGYGGDMYEWRKIEGEYICVDCGDEPGPEPEPLNALFKLSNTNNGNVFQQPCTSDGVITADMTRNLTKSEYNRLQIGDCCKEIGDGSPWGPFSAWTSLQGDLVIPNSVTKIENHAFIYCSGFTGNLVISNKVSYIGPGAFYGCSGFTSLTLGTGLTTIDNEAFQRCYGFKGDLAIPDKVEYIGSHAFERCTGFTGTLTLGTGLTTIGDWAFLDCSGFTGNLVIPDKMTSIGLQCFNGCKGFNGTLTLPTGLTSIGPGAFSDCGFTGDLVIPDSVTEIDEGAFTECRGFTSLTIGTGVTSIGLQGFMICNNLKAIYCKATTPPTLGRSVFYATNNCPIYVPSASVNAYKTASGWSTYASRIQGY